MAEPTSDKTFPRPVRKRGKKKMTQERFMVMFTLFFFVGVLLLTLIPEEHGARGMVMGIYSVVVFWFMFRFGI